MSLTAFAAGAYLIEKCCVVSLSSCPVGQFSVPPSFVWNELEMRAGLLVIGGTRASIGNRNDSLIDRRRSNYHVG